MPAGLERVVLKGLERDRGRRWQSLDELRAALAALVPEQLTFGGMGVRVGAYLLDELLVRLAILVVFGWLAAFGDSKWVDFVVFPLYFVVLEGRYGASLGKRLLGLRVCRVGTTEPPGFKRAAVRMLVFYLLVTLTFGFGPIVEADLAMDGELSWRSLLGVVPFVLGLALLIVPMRRRNDFRGLHELASGTCVLRLPRPERPLSLPGRRGDRLAALPPRPAAVPEAVGPYAVTRGVPADGGWILVGDDAVLGRHVLLRVVPEGSPASPSQQGPVSRPGRLRRLGTGTVEVDGKPFAWEAWVAPAGAPLADLATPARRLTWPEVRPLLEQLADELAVAEIDGTLPKPLGVDRVWVRPDGRVQVLDFPVPGTADEPAEGIDGRGLIRQAATALLEGSPRTDAAPVRGEPPIYAARWLAGVPSAADAAAVRAGLAASRDGPDRVTRTNRLVQLVIQAALLAPGLAAMFVLAAWFKPLTTWADPAYRTRVLAAASAEKAGDLDDARRWRAEAEGMLPPLHRRQRAALQEFETTLGGADAAVAVHGPQRPVPLGDAWRPFVAAILAVPMMWGVGAFAWRGGPSMTFAGRRWRGWTAGRRRGGSA